MVLFTSKLLIVRELTDIDVVLMNEVAMRVFTVIELSMVAQ